MSSEADEALVDFYADQASIVEAQLVKVSQATVKALHHLDMFHETTQFAVAYEHIQQARRALAEVQPKRRR